MNTQQLEIFPRSRTRKRTTTEVSGNGASLTVGFRLDGECLSVLAQRAALHEVSIHQYARGLVLQTLSEAENRADLGAAVVQLQADVQQLRRDFVLAVEALLIAAGKLNQKEAAEWIQRNYQPR